MHTLIKNIVMRKLFIPTLAAFLMLSCDKSYEKTAQTTAETTTDHTAGHSSEHMADSAAQTNKNEMLAEMDEMMREMHSAKFSGNIDADFAEMMADHHDGAVEMSEILLQKGTDAELKDFAAKVVAAQNKEIAILDRFDDAVGVSAENVAFQKDLQRSMAAMMDKNIKIHNDIDKDYAQQMIPHHQSAVDMAKVYLKYGKQKELLKLCNDIISTQTSEIDYLKDWLAKR
ncbi:putative exported protein [Flavobacteriaceae bacterium 3519-10]|nr:putative exported protein [Flavobacteriaceae bacterium 3519-10]